LLDSLLQESRSEHKMDGKGEYEPVNNGKQKIEPLKEEQVGLKASLGLVQGCTIIVGSIIGSGIFIAPGGVLKQTGSVNLSLSIWILSGLFSMVGAYCYAELGLLIRKPGGDYTYILDTLGPFIGFIRLWAECLIVRPCTITIVALTFAKYSVKLLFPECDPPDESVRILAAVCICMLAFINCWDVKWATTVQDIFTYAKLLALFIIIATGIVQLGRGQTQNFTWEDTEEDFTKIALSFYSGLFAYNGWNYLNFVIEELQDPVRNLPRAIAISIILVTIVYALTNIAFYTTLGVPEVLGSEAVAVTFAEVLWTNGIYHSRVFVAMSTFGGVNGILLTSSRLFYAGAVQGQMPEILSMIQVNKMTPAPAVLGVAALSLVYLTSSNIFALINYTGFATWVSIGLAVFCIPWLRWKHPEWDRPIKVNLIFPIIYILATIFITVVPMISTPVETAIGLGIIATGIPVYFIFIAWKDKPVFIKRIISGSTTCLQKLFVVVSPPKKTN